MLAYFKTLHPWALLLVAIAIVLATVFTGARGIVGKLLWTAAAVLAVVGAVASWRR